MTELTNTKATTAAWGKALGDMPEAYQQAIALRAAGVTWKVVTEETGVGYASGWLAEQRVKFIAEKRDGLLLPADVAKMTPSAFNAWVTERRLTHDESWGTIMSLCGVPEGRVRAGFEVKTNVFSEGLRNGKGGRFLAGNAEAYAPAPKVGWVRKAEPSAILPAEIMAGLVKAGVATEDVEELAGMTKTALAAFAKGLGLKASGSKPTLIARIAEAMGTEPTAEDAEDEVLEDEEVVNAE